MAMTIEAEKTSGTASASPKPEEKIVFTTPEEMEKYETMIDKDFVRVDAARKPTAAAKEFFYRIVSLHPSQPGGYIGNDFVCQFGVQKYFRNKFTSTTKDGKKVKRHEMVQQFDGDGKLLDSEASFFMDCSKFEKQFAIDG